MSQPNPINMSLLSIQSHGAGYGQPPARGTFPISFEELANFMRNYDVSTSEGALNYYREFARDIIRRNVARLPVVIKVSPRANDAFHRNGGNWEDMVYHLSGALKENGESYGVSVDVKDRESVAPGIGMNVLMQNVEIKIRPDQLSDRNVIPVPTFTTTAEPFAQFRAMAPQDAVNMLLEAQNQPDIFRRATMLATAIQGLNLYILDDLKGIQRRLGAEDIWLLDQNYSAIQFMAWVNGEANGFFHVLHGEKVYHHIGKKMFYNHSGYVVDYDKFLEMSSRCVALCRLAGCNCGAIIGYLLIAIGIAVFLINDEYGLAHILGGICAGAGVLAWLAGVIFRAGVDFDCLDSFPTQKCYDLNNAVIPAIGRMLGEVDRCISAGVLGQLNIRGGTSAQRVGEFLIKTFAQRAHALLGEALAPNGILSDRKFLANLSGEQFGVFFTLFRLTSKNTTGMPLSGDLTDQFMGAMANMIAFAPMDVHAFLMEFCRLTADNFNKVCYMNKNGFHFEFDEWPILFRKLQALCSSLEPHFASMGSDMQCRLRNIKTAMDLEINERIHAPINVNHWYH